jgi:hypothetical protein
MNPKRNRGGFAMVMAIMLMGIVAITLAALNVDFTIDARRSATMAQGAQLRQLLLAGAHLTENSLSVPESAQKFAVPLPGFLNQRGAALAVNIQAAIGSDSRQATVEATLDNHHMVQHLYFVPNGKKQEIIDAQF